MHATHTSRSWYYASTAACKSVFLTVRLLALLFSEYAFAPLSCTIYAHVCKFIRLDIARWKSNFQKQRRISRSNRQYAGLNWQYGVLNWQYGGFTEEFQVLLGKYADTQPQRYLQTQPREKRKQGFLSGLPLPLPRSLPACRLFFRQCPHARFCVLSNYYSIFLLVLITQMRH